MGDKCPPCKKGAPLWVLTYGDMMSLLLCFFILLLSFASMDVVKFKQVAGSMREAFGVQQVEMILPMPVAVNLIGTEFTQEVILVRLVEKLQVIISPLIDEGEAELIELDEGFLLTLRNDSLFTAGVIRLRSEMEPILQQVANQMSLMNNMIYVTGHTDNLPPDPGSPYPSNWAASAAMASAVVNFLATKGGIDPGRMEARGKGEFAPVASNEIDEERAKNRRVEILISRVTKPTGLEPPAAAEAPTTATSEVVEGRPGP